MPRNSPTKKELRRWALVAFFILALGYGIWQARDLLFGIRLSVSGIQDGSSVSENTLTLSGLAHHAVFAEVNGNIVSVAQNGSWQKTIALLPGLNTVRVRAGDKFGKTVLKEFTIFYKAPAPEQQPEGPVKTEEKEIPSGDVNDSSQESPSAVQ